MSIADRPLLRFPRDFPRYCWMAVFPLHPFPKWPSYEAIGEISRGRKNRICRGSGNCGDERRENSLPNWEIVGRRRSRGSPTLPDSRCPALFKPEIDELFSEYEKQREKDCIVQAWRCKTHYIYYITENNSVKVRKTDRIFVFFLFISRDQRHLRGNNSEKLLNSFIESCRVYSTVYCTFRVTIARRIRPEQFRLYVNY